MDYDRIIIELLSRVQALEDKIATLDKNSTEVFVSSSDEALEIVVSSKKYRLLSDYLYSSKDDMVKLTFEDIEKILGFKPPPSAYVHRAFWANTKTHSIALSWMGVGYETVEVSIKDRYVVFERTPEYRKVAFGKRKVTEMMPRIGSIKLNELTNAELKGGET